MVAAAFVNVTAFEGLVPTSAVTQVVEAGESVEGEKTRTAPLPPLPLDTVLVLSEKVTLPILDEARIETEPT